MISESGSAWRWRLATLLNRSPRLCWPDLVTYALHWFPKDRPLRDAFEKGTSRCRADADRDGSCYCGKFSTEPGDVNLCGVGFRPDGTKVVRQP